MLSVLINCKLLVLSWILESADLKLTAVILSFLKVMWEVETQKVVLKMIKVDKA